MNSMFAELHARIASLLPDSIYLRLVYPRIVGRPLHLRHPVTLNEKTNWLKIHDRRPVYRIMADKLKAKQFVADKAGSQFVVPLLGSWDKFDDIPFDSLPDRFVLKTNHDSGGVVICRDKATLDMDAARRKLEKSLARDYFRQFREWAYKGMPRKILAEEFLEPPDGGELVDYKVFTFNGEAKLAFAATNRQGPGDVLMNFYDRDWNSIPVARLHARNPVETPKPAGWETMIRLAETFGKDMYLLRTDCYQVGDRVYVGELTIYPSGGIDPFDPESYDTLFGSWLKLPCDRSKD